MWPSAEPACVVFDGVRVGVDVGGTTVAVFEGVRVGVEVGGTAVNVDVGVQVAVGGSEVGVRVAVAVAVAVEVGVGLGLPPPEAGRRTKTLNSGPVGAGAATPMGVATERLFIGSVIEPPE